MMTNLFLTVFEISVSASLIVAVLLFLTPFLNRRYAAKWKYWIWIFLALRLIIPFSGTTGQLLADTLAQIKSRTAAETGNSPADTPPVQTAPPRRVIVEIPAQMTTPLAPHITLLDLAAVVWMTGSLVFLSLHLIPYLHFKNQIRKKGTYITDAAILRQMSGLKQELRIRRIVHLVEYPEAASPMILGFLKPVLILPEEQYRPEALYFILKHELVHLKRGDVYRKLLFMAANAVHWFNPLIWIMQKEAAVDMELSCDERVTQDTDFAVRKAYTETLLSTLHKQCAKGPVLSTQFYGGKQIMKKRFKNILTGKGKKNGVCILLCAVVLTVSMGTLIGCSVREPEADKLVDESENVLIMENHPEADNITPENTTTLTFYKEGEPEEKQATLMIRDGYSIYLPDGEWQQSDMDKWFPSDDVWHKSGSDAWATVINEQVRLWVTHFENTAISEVEKELGDDGYEKQEGGTIYKVRLHESDNDVWGIFCSYPAEAEEGWGRVIPVIADTFAVSVAEGQVQNNSLEASNAYLNNTDRQKIRNIVDTFSAAYFSGDTGTLQKFLTSPYEWRVSAYEGTGTISDLTVKGLSDADEQQTENGTYVVSLEYRDSDNADTFQYLTFTFVRQEEDWKIQFYGLDG